MRYFIYHPSEKETVIRKRFALLPITIGHETRWLETVYIAGYWQYGIFDWWNPTHFATKAEYEKMKEIHRSRIEKHKHKNTFL